MIKGLLIGFGLFVVVGGYTYGRTDSFKLKCAAHLRLGMPLALPDRVLCESIYG